MVGSIIGGVGKIGSAIFGAAASAKANNKARQLLAQTHKDTQNWYDRKLNEDYMSRTDVKAALTSQRELLDQQYKNARATNAVMGGSDEALAMMQRNANDTLADTTRSIASSAAAYKDSLENQRLAENQSYSAQMQNYHKERGQIIANAASQVGDAMSSMGSGISKLRG